MPDLQRLRDTNPTAFALRGGAVVLVAGALGYLLNLTPVSVFNGTALVFGGIASLGVALRYGPLYGALTAALAFVPTLGYWEHPLALGLAVLEAALVGSLRHLAPARLHRTHALFWLVAGGPALAAWYFFVREVPLEYNALVVAKSIANGIIVLGLARLAVALPRVYGRPLQPEHRRTSTMRDFVLGAAAVAIALPALGTLLGIVRLFEASSLHTEAHALKAAAVAVADAVEEATDARLASLTGIARDLGARGRIDATVAQGLLDAFGSADPHFITMLVTDARGGLVAGYAPDSAVVSMLRTRGFSVADRAYFRIPRSTGRPYVSDVFIGRGFGNDRIIALSAPILDRDGRFLGVVEGSVNTVSYGRVLANLPPEMRVNVLSRQRRIVTWNGPTVPPLVTYDSLQPRLLVSEVFDAADPILTGVLFERIDAPRLPMAEQQRLVASVTTGMGWRVVASASVADTQADVRRILQLITLLALAAFLVVRLLFVGVLRDVLEPIEILRASVAGEQGSEGAFEPVAPRLSPRAPRELVVLAEGVDAMHHAIGQRVAELRRTVQDRDAVNGKLEQITFALDQLVKERTQQLEGALEEARRASATKAEFLASMSHELRTPLNAIVGAVESIEDGVYGPVSEGQRNALRGVDESARHLLALIGDILDMERIEAGRLQVKRERVDVRALADRIRAAVQPLADTAKLSLQVELPAGALWIDADPLRLQQVLINLLGNAVKFTPAGGQVTLRVKTGTIPGRVRRFEVEDTGIGIPEDQRDRVFEPFAQVESGHTRRFGGTGLGLSISRALCGAMGLSLAIEHSSPQGTVFSVTA